MIKKRFKVIIILVFFTMFNTLVFSKGSGEQGAGGNGNRGGSEFGLKDADVEKRVDVVEALISQYMKQEGFDYYPVSYKIARDAMDSNSRKSTLSADDFRKQFGWGITTILVTSQNQGRMGLGDLNNNYRDSLSPADKVAYDRALFGKNTEATFVVGLDSEDFSLTGGATRRAIEQAFTKDELGAGFVNYQNAESLKVDEDQRIIDAYKKWSDAMLNNGYKYNSSDAIKTELTTLMEELTKGTKDLNTLSKIQKDDLLQLQNKERILAELSHKLDLKYVDPVRKKVEAELLGPGANQ